MTISILATCNLNQWALDFEGNTARIRQSISKARSQNARYRIGPELEVSGYGCEDHFLELDTFQHSWECIASIIEQGDSDNMFLDIGAPIMHNGVAYNARILVIDRHILLIRPKVDLADHGNYRESRWFRSWSRSRGVEDFRLPQVMRQVCKNLDGFCKIGQAIIEFDDGITVGCETCEELWTTKPMHIDLFLNGVDIIGNGSGSHHSLRILGTRLDLLRSATQKGGGVYLYSNQIGCDGGRLYFDGSALVALNGEIVCQGSQFTLSSEVEVITAVVDIQDVRTYRTVSASRSAQAAQLGDHERLPRIRVPTKFSLAIPEDETRSLRLSEPIKPREHFPEEEIALGPACWLWDYLRRSGLNGFFLPLSGGSDSASTAAIVGSMCQLLVKASTAKDCEERLLNDIRAVTKTGPDYIPTDGSELANRILHTVYMGSTEASSAETKSHAKALSEEIGGWHVSIEIDRAVTAVLEIFSSVFGNNKRPRFRVDNGTRTENLALQNVQARIRMVIGYLFAQLTLWGRGREGSLLVLGSANVDEGLRGYLTKYDCSAADINPIGGISKTDLRRFLRWASSDNGLGYHTLRDIVEAPPTAELEPLREGHAPQTDEEDMGMTYEELSWYGRLRKLMRCGPYSMYKKLGHTWMRDLTAEEVGKKVKFFFRMYAINRHKLTTLTPSYHAENYSPEDNRFDLRQFLYNVRWTWQFRKIDEDVARERKIDGVNGQ